jgi:hypothetical protein
MVHCHLTDFLYTSISPQVALPFGVIKGFAEFGLGFEFDPDLTLIVKGAIEHTIIEVDFEHWLCLCSFCCNAPR